MRKAIAVIIVILLIFMRVCPAKANEESNSYITSNLSFNGTTAVCSLDVIGCGTYDPIVATVTLKHGNTIVKQWVGLTGTGYLSFSDTAQVVYGNTYTMQVTVCVNGNVIGVGDITKTCN